MLCARIGESRCQRPLSAPPVATKLSSRAATVSLANPLRRPRLRRPGRPPSVVRIPTLVHAPVIHIGFLSTKRILSPDRKMRASKKCHGLSVSFCCCTFCSVTPTYRHAQTPWSFFFPAKFAVVHFSSPPAAGRRLFRALIHLDLGRGPFC